MVCSVVTVVIAIVLVAVPGIPVSAVAEEVGSDTVKLEVVPIDDEGVIEFIPIRAEVSWDPAEIEIKFVPGSPQSVPAVQVRLLPAPHRTSAPRTWSSPGPDPMDTSYPVRHREIAASAPTLDADPAVTGVEVRIGALAPRPRRVPERLRLVPYSVGTPRALRTCRSSRVW